MYIHVTVFVLLKSPPPHHHTHQSTPSLLLQQYNHKTEILHIMSSSWKGCKSDWFKHLNSTAAKYTPGKTNAGNKMVEGLYTSGNDLACPHRPTDSPSASCTSVSLAPLLSNTSHNLTVLSHDPLANMALVPLVKARQLTGPVWSANTYTYHSK